MSKKLDIITLYLRDYGLSFSGREIARQIKFSPQATLTVLKQMVKDKILFSVKEGRNIKYGLNKNNLICKSFLQMAEINKANGLLSNFEISVIVKELLPWAETLIVFGSFAKGLEKKDSDLDLVMVGVKEKEKVRKVKRAFAREVNIHFVNWRWFVKTLREKNHLAIEIKKDHLIYGNVFKIVEVYGD